MSKRELLQARADLARLRQAARALLAALEAADRPLGEAEAIAFVEVRRVVGECIDQNRDAGQEA